MTYKRFEDLPVWKAAMALAVRVFDLVQDASFSGQGDVRDQLQRSSFSSPQNIAEGFESGTTALLLQFIYIARGSAGETRSGLHFVRMRPRFEHLWGEVEALIKDAEAVSRQLRGWAESLQNSDIRGHRYLTEAVREHADREARAVAFVEKLKRIQRGEAVASGVVADGE